MSDNKDKIALENSNSNKKDDRALPIKHDEFIKRFLQGDTTSREFLETYLPEKFKTILDLNTIKVEQESFVDSSSLNKKMSDIVYSAKTNDGKDALIFTLLEHQSKSDHWIAFRLWQYSLLLLERYKDKKKKLPILIPIVIYNGKDRYNAPTSFWDLFQDPVLAKDAKDAKDAMGDHHQLINLKIMPDDEIGYDKYISFMLFLMKHIHDSDLPKMFKEAIKRCMNVINLDKASGYIHMKLGVCYISSKLPLDERDEFEKIIRGSLPTNDGDNVMQSVLDSYVAEGIHIGKQEGKAEGKAEGKVENSIEVARNLLKAGVEIETISNATGLSLDEIRKLQTRH